MADDDAKTSQLLIAWYLCYAPRTVVNHIKLGDERSFSAALNFGKWCVLGSLALATAIAGKNADGPTGFLWQEVSFIALAGNLLFLYPVLLLIAWKRLRLQSFVHIYCYVLMFGVLKLIAYYIGQFVPIALLFVWPIDVWGLFVLAFLLKNVLGLPYWKVAFAFIATVVAIGFGLALFAPSYLAQLKS